MSSVNGTCPRPEVEAHLSRPRSARPRCVRQPKRLSAVRLSVMRRWLTVGMGCGIPGLSLALSSLGGQLLRASQIWLGGGSLALCASVLAVSLSHLAAAVQDITRSARWQGWCLAVAIDVSLVLCELARVAGEDCWLVLGLMSAVTAASMGLNCWAFLRHGKGV
jgi:hypothetical protein